MTQKIKQKLKGIKEDVEHNLNVCGNLHKHLLDPKYSPKHRFRAGAMIMFIGVGLVKVSGLTELWIIHFVADVIGYGIHGIGLIVFANLIEKGGKKDGNTGEKQGDNDS